MSMQAQTNNKHNECWKPIASMNVLDGRQYENEQEFNQPVQYKINPIGSYVGEHAEFLSIPKHNELPKLIPNVRSLINEDLNKGFKQVLNVKLSVNNPCTLCQQNKIKTHIQTQHLITKTNTFTDVLTQHFSSFDIAKSGIEFITFRNNLNKIMAAPYFHSRAAYDAFAIDVIKKNGIIYLEIVDRACLLKDDKSNKDNNNNNNNNNDNGNNVGPEWWGRRFEELCRHFPIVNDDEECKQKDNTDIDSTGNKESDKNDIHDNRELITLIQSELNGHKLLMAAEIDCINDNGGYVEIKTQKYIVPKTNKQSKYPPPHLPNECDKGSQSNTYSKHQRTDSKIANSYRHHPYPQSTYKANKYNPQRNEIPIIPWYKTLKIWIQSYLGGVNNILMGFRDEKGMVVDVTTLSLNYFTNKINYFDKKKRQKVSKGNVCLNFTDYVLRFIKNNCKSEECIYRIVFNEPWKHLVLYSKQM